MAGAGWAAGCTCFLLPHRIRCVCAERPLSGKGSGTFPMGTSVFLSFDPRLSHELKVSLPTVASISPISVTACPFWPLLCPRGPSRGPPSWSLSWPLALWPFVLQSDPASLQQDVGRGRERVGPGREVPGQPAAWTPPRRQDPQYLLLEIDLSFGTRPNTVYFFAHMSVKFRSEVSTFRQNETPPRSSGRYGALRA